MRSHAIRRHALAAIVVSLAAVPASSQGPSRLAGVWDAVVVVNNVDIPFTFELTGAGESIVGSFFDGDQRVSSTAGRLDNGSLVVEFAQYGAKLDATVAGDRLDGRYDRGTRGVYPFRATRHTAPSSVSRDAPSIAGVWKIPVKSPKGESAWRFIVRQDGAEVSAAILRVDGDTGTLSGSFRDGRFVLSHFSGARPTLLEVTAAADGTLELLQNRQTRYVAVRVDAANAGDIAEPTDPTRHTRVKDPGAPFEFSFPDLNGKVVSQSDSRFQGKVVVVNISGSWCPNCHDEAPFLVELDRAYRQKGLEIVTLSFEEATQLDNPTRLRAFLKRYGIDYTVLLAGEPEQLAARIPQAENLNAFPTTFVLDRKGRVRSIHAGFPSAASGDFHRKAKEEMIAELERLLAESPTSSD